MKKIPIVEKDKSVIKDVRKALQFDHFEIIEASNGWDGLEFANEIMPDLIISNINLPQHTGIQFSKQTKKYPIINKIPFILITQNRNNAIKIYLCLQNTDCSNFEEMSIEGFMNYKKSFIHNKIKEK